MSNMFSMLKQAKEMQKKLQSMQEEIANIRAVGQAGAGLVEVELTGQHRMERLTIDKTAINPEDKEMLEDLILAAYNDAKQKLDTLIAEKGSALTGGLPIPPDLKSLF